MKWDAEKQVNILLTPAVDRAMEVMRKGLLKNAGDTEEAAARRLIDILQDSALVGSVSALREPTVYADADPVPMRTLYNKVKLLTPPSHLFIRALVTGGVPYSVADKVSKYLDFLNFKHHAAALVLSFFLLEKFRHT